MKRMVDGLKKRNEGLKFVCGLLAAALLFKTSNRSELSNFEEKNTELTG